MSGPACAHLSVSFRTESVPFKRGRMVVRGWWECDSNCGTKFWPVPLASPMTESPSGSEEGCLYHEQDLRARAATESPSVSSESGETWQGRPCPRCGMWWCVDAEHWLAAPAPPSPEAEPESEFVKAILDAMCFAVTYGLRHDITTGAQERAGRLYREAVAQRDDLADSMESIADSVGYGGNPRTEHGTVVTIVRGILEVHGWNIEALRTELSEAVARAEKAEAEPQFAETDAVLVREAADDLQEMAESRFGGFSEKSMVCRLRKLADRLDAAAGVSGE